MIEIDGSILEGGGQILRTALAFSVITKNPIKVSNIRKRRKKPGLRPQHLLGIQALTRFCEGKTEGDEIGSTIIEFYPGIPKGKDILVKIPTAASITLLFQGLLPSLISAPSSLEVTFRGGATDTFFSPSFDYLQHVFLKILQKRGVETKTEIVKRGYYPEGGANLKIRVFPSSIEPFRLRKRGEFQQISIFSRASNSLQERKVAERQVKGAKEILNKLKLPTKETISYHPTSCPGSQISLTAEFDNTTLGADNLGKLGKKAEEVGREAALKLIEEERTKACLDHHMADQILPYLALSKKKSEVKVSRITNHCRANMQVIERFNKGKFKTKDNIIIWIPTG